MIKATNITYAYTDSPLFEKGTFTVGDGMKVGLVGPNGAGKSTMFNLILGKDQVEEGSLEVTGTVSLVPQEVKHDPAMEAAWNIREYINPYAMKEDHELEAILRGLEFNRVDLNSSTKGLSGGQKTKLALARSLISEPDLLLLDEPTNFLDIEGKKWVMSFLASYPNTLLIISHDLKLLDRHIDKVISINPQSKTIEEYNGNYSTYVSVKKQQEEIVKRHIVTEQKHLKHMKKGLQRLARNTSKKGVRQRVMLKKRIQRIEDALPEMPKELKTMHFALRDPAWVGKVPIMAKHISKSYGGNAVLQDVSLTIQRYERIALIGPNGVGKSTFIKIIMNMIEPDNGSLIPDEKLKIGYYSQEFETFDMEKTVMETMLKHTEIESYARALLARFLFRRDKIDQKVSTLSGGEKTRLSIALLLAKDYNVLVLDEPTTYLDVLSQRIILEALKAYKGTMLVVSHTEDFIRELKPTRALILPENNVVDWTDELLERVSLY